MGFDLSNIYTEQYIFILLDFSLDIWNIENEIAPNSFLSSSTKNLLLQDLGVLRYQPDKECKVITTDDGWTSGILCLQLNVLISY